MANKEIERIYKIKAKMSNIKFFPEVKEIHTFDEHQIEEIYSAWKQWAITDFNLKYLPAFEVMENNKINIINDWVIIRK